MEIIERYSLSNDLLTLVILLVLLLLVMAKQLYPYRFQDFLALFNSGKFMAIKSREHKALFGFNVLMLIIHLLSISVFIFLLYREFVDPQIKETGVLFLQIFTGYSFLVLLKITVEKIIGNVFDLDDIIDNYLFQKHAYRNFITLGVLAFSIFLVYIPHFPLWTYYLIFGCLIVATLISFSRIASKNLGLVTHNMFYFILYLCALEIAPYIVLYKLILRS